MTDRELLELAAKADGHGYPWYEAHRGQMMAWNPLTDDGDALRLAVKLNIDVFYQSDDDGRFTSAEGRSNSYAYEHHKADPHAATRRAIVRAAAAIGAAK